MASSPVPLGASRPQPYAHRGLWMYAATIVVVCVLLGFCLIPSLQRSRYGGWHFDSISLCLQSIHQATARYRETHGRDPTALDDLVGIQVRPGALTDDFATEQPFSIAMLEESHAGGRYVFLPAHWHMGGAVPLAYVREPGADERYRVLMVDGRRERMTKADLDAMLSDAQGATGSPATRPTTATAP